MSAIFLSDTFQNLTGADVNLDSHTADNGATWAATTGGAGALVITPSGFVRAGLTNTQGQATSSIACTGTKVKIAFDAVNLGGNTDFLDIFIGQFVLRCNGATNTFQLLNANTGYSTVVSASGLGSTVAHVEFFCSQTSQTITVNGANGWTDPAITANTVSGAILLNTLSVSAPSDGAGTQIANLAAYNVTTLNVLAPDTAAIVLSPGNQYVNPGVSLQWIMPGTYAKLDFSGTSATVTVDNSRMVSGSRTLAQFPYLNWSVDGNFWRRAQLKPGQTYLTLASGLASGTHTLEVIYEPQNPAEIWGVGSTPPVDSTLITGWLLDTSATISAPTGNAAAFTKTAIVLGDSITWGYYAWFWPGDPVGSTIAINAKFVHAQFARLLGKFLQCEMGIIGYPGQGIGWTYSSDSPTLPSTYNKYDSVHSSVWPTGLNYVFVNETTNDPDAASSATLAGYIVTLLTNIRAKAGAQAIIVFTPAFAQALVNIHDGGNIGTTVSAAIATYKNATGDQKVLFNPVYLDMNNTAATIVATPPIYSQYTVDSTHLTGEGHAIVAGITAVNTRAFESGGGGADISTSAGNFATGGSPVITSAGAFAS